jgi:hypothetical protein
MGKTVWVMRRTGEKTSECGDETSREMTPVLDAVTYVTGGRKGWDKARQESRAKEPTSVSIT